MNKKSKFKVGDKVRIIKEDLVGTVIKVDEYGIYILDVISNHFYYIVEELELVK